MKQTWNEVKDKKYRKYKNTSFEEGNVKIEKPHTRFKLVLTIALHSNNIIQPGF